MSFHSSCLKKAGFTLASCGAILGISVYLSSCGGNTSNDTDTSGQASENAVATVGGAVTSSSGDSVARIERGLREAWAFNLCPTTATTQGAGCSASTPPPATLTLTYGSAGCTFGSASAPWTGGTLLTVTPNNYPVACGPNRFPYLGRTSGGVTVTALNRTYLGNLGGSTVTTRGNATGTITVVIDTSAPSSATFANANASTPTSGTGGYSWNISSGGGYTLTAGSQPGADSLGIAIRLVAFSGSTPTGKALFDYTISTTNSAGVNTPLSVTESGTVRSVNGTTYLQHNLAGYTATTTFTSVGHDTSSACCYPTSGTITTSFSGGVNHGKSESFTFNSATCAPATRGQVSFTDAKGAIGTHTLTHCY